MSGLPILELAEHSPVPAGVHTRLGAWSLEAYNLGAYNVRATDFSELAKHSLGSWKSTQSTGSLESGSLQTGSLGLQILGAYNLWEPTVGSLQSRATDSGAGEALSELGAYRWGAYSWEPTISSNRFWGHGSTF